MDEDIPPWLQCVLDSLERGDVPDTSIPPEQFDAVSVDKKKALLKSIQQLVDDDTVSLNSFLPLLSSALDADNRAVRLTTAKLLVSVAETTPDAILELVPVLAARVADDDEFYYVRARSAEALGYVALEHPDEVATPELLADLRLGLSFDEPEVTQKLSKALEHVALGDPRRLRHHVPTLAEHLADDDELVRCHLCTALVVVGSESPDRLADVADDLRIRLSDDSTFVRGRAAERRLGDLCDADEPFVADRARFALSALGGTADPDGPTPGVGTIESVSASTADAAEEIRSPDSDGMRPSCGFPLAESGPPMCPRCGQPH
ncbi:hypothetical protein SAMN04487949_2832 [Halogranum gelatinilyticum]|uniref:HEAT repeat-containing protein n=1 Tax=Halogranum gelatinilyticum TaxID=660521 RepID=A0A1G9X557_9EURY|nr:hypothetical protein [Halogranum gelatinilyticum]SDM91505.1 hypothetical protein SAMN04487949_2832 [Halogranum gelatinilyticum]